MLKVRVELAEFKKRSTDYHQALKKDERLQNAERNCVFLRDELIQIISQMDKLK
mgnify:CR=1 FL=1|jgi:hypothetical protein